ncbi:MAG TPA: DUF2961 domain-containing protein [Kiritimatiellia bacterium]|nr:DUF2961 domain-containing protein [Kiritimatiellia bacterium]
MSVKTFLGAACVAALVALAGCGREAAEPGRPWRAFVEDLTNTVRLANGEAGGTRLISTADPRGGNDDFNQFAGPGSEPGWVTLADLKGPGVVRRFWTTGVDPGHRFRLFFDGEKKARWEGEVDELFGGRAPFTPPLARYLNLCWFSYVPLTYQRGLRIEAQAPPTHPFWGPRRFFFQLNVEDFAADARVQTFPARLDAEDRAVLVAVAARWTEAVEWPEARPVAGAGFEVAPGAETTLWQAEGPGLVPDWQIAAEPLEGAAWTVREREWMLQDVVLRIRYNGQAGASVDVPLGDFFGTPWRHRHYGSLLLGAAPGVFRSAFPLAYTGAVSVSLFNGCDRPIQARFDGTPEPLAGGVARHLHAEWRRSGPEAGQPHVIAIFMGRGLFAGAFLGVTGAAGTQQDDSWWLLEGDEYIWVDDETQPSWRGTGLEDYFNGGWYYRSCAFSAFHGIFDRSPFRVAQYRHQLVDPVAFQRSLRMAIERGDQSVSRAWFQSVAFAYLENPAPVQSTPARREDRRPPEDRFWRQTMMLQLTELERMNNFAKAIDLIEEFREREPAAPENGVYALRALEYRRLLGETVTDEQLAPFLNGEHGPEAAEQAKLLAWFHADSRRALVGLNANAQAQLYLNGQPLARGDHPLAWQVVGVELDAGPLALCADATMVRQEPWVQMGLRTHGGFAGSGIETRRARRVAGTWNALTGDQTEWRAMENRDLLRGTPDAPFIGSIPNAFVLFGAKSYSVRSEDWGYHQGRGYFRMDLSLPLDSWPAQARDVTGLPR